MEEELLRSLSGDSLFHLGAVFKPAFYWLAPTFATLQLCGSSVCACSHSSLILTWPWTCLIAVDALGDDQAVADPGYLLPLDWPSLAYSTCLLVLLRPCCFTTQSREGIDKFTKEIPIHSIAATCQKRCVRRLQVSALSTLSQKECSWSSVLYASSFNNCSRKWITDTYTWLDLEFLEVHAIILIWNSLLKEKRGGGALSTFRDCLGSSSQMTNIYFPNGYWQNTVRVSWF